MAAGSHARRGHSGLAILFACLAALVLARSVSFALPAAGSRPAAALATTAGATAAPATGGSGLLSGLAIAGVAVAAAGLASSRARARRFATVEDTDQETARDLDGSLWDVVANTDAYIEEDRKYRRPVFGYPDWKRHRSAERQPRNLLSLPVSTTIRANWKEVTAVALVSLAVCLWNDAEVAGQAAGLDAATMGVLKDLPTLTLPALPFTLSSASLSLLLVFRTNKAYDRWWEARCIWGAIINTCRDIVRQALVRMDPKDMALKEEVTRLVSAYPRSLIYHLGERTEISNAVIEKKYRKILTDEETERLLNCTHKPMTVTGMLSDAVRRAQLPTIDEMKIDADITKFSDYYGMCERIFKTPMPLSYTRLTSRFLSIWMLCLPFALYGAVTPHWLIVPISALIAFFIFGIEEIGMQIEEPFSVLAMNTMADGIDASVFEALALEKGEPFLFEPAGGWKKKPEAAGLAAQHRRPAQPEVADAFQAKPAAPAAAKEAGFVPGEKSNLAVNAEGRLRFKAPGAVDVVEEAKFAPGELSNLLINAEGQPRFKSADADKPRGLGRLAAWWRRLRSK